MHDRSIEMFSNKSRQDSKYSQLPERMRTLYVSQYKEPTKERKKEKKRDNEAKNMKYITKVTLSAVYTANS